MTCFQLLIGSHGLWVDGGYASVGLTFPCYVNVRIPADACFVGVGWADGRVLESLWMYVVSDR